MMRTPSMRAVPARRGLALLELLVVCAILGTSLGAGIYLATQGLLLNARAMRLDRATVLAQNELAWWESQGAAAARALGPGIHRFQNPVATAPENAGAVTRLEVREVEPGITEVAAAVELPSPQPNHPLRVRMVTWLGDKGERR